MISIPYHTFNMNIIRWWCWWASNFCIVFSGCSPWFEKLILIMALFVAHPFFSTISCKFWVPINVLPIFKRNFIQILLFFKNLNFLYIRKSLRQWNTAKLNHLHTGTGTSGRLFLKNHILKMCVSCRITTWVICFKSSVSFWTYLIWFNYYIDFKINF